MSHFGKMLGYDFFAFMALIMGAWAVPDLLRSMSAQGLSHPHVFLTGGMPQHYVVWAIGIALYTAMLLAAIIFVPNYCRLSRQTVSIGASLLRTCAALMCALFVLIGIEMSAELGNMAWYGAPMCGLVYLIILMQQARTSVLA